VLIPSLTIIIYNIQPVNIIRKILTITRVLDETDFDKQARPSSRSMIYRDIRRPEISFDRASWPRQNPFIFF